MSDQAEMFSVDNQVIGMYRTDDLPPARDAAIASLSVVQANRLLILQLLLEAEEPLTMFDPFVLMGQDYRFKQTTIGTRFAGLVKEGLIKVEQSRRPLAGAESQRLVSAFSITPAGVEYLKKNLARS